MDKPPINARFPLIVVKRPYYDQFAAGTKTVERRLHRPPFTARAFYPGRWVRIAYNYNVAKTPSLIAKVARFDVTRACDLESAVYYALLQIYPQIVPDSELALITLAVMERAGEAQARGVSTPR